MATLDQLTAQLDHDVENGALPLDPTRVVDLPGFQLQTSLLTGQVRQFPQFSYIGYHLL